MSYMAKRVSLTIITFLAVLAVSLICQGQTGALFAALAPGAEFSVGKKLGIAPYDQVAAAAAAGGPGYLVVWQDNRSNGNYDIFGILVDGAGNPITGESFLISSAPSQPLPGDYPWPNNELAPAVAYNGYCFLVVWQDHRLSSSSSHIYGARVSTTGTVLDPNGFIISSTTSSQLSAAAASNGVDWEVVWEDIAATIYGARVTSTGTVTNLQGLEVTGNSTQAPAIAWNGSNYLLAWQDSRDAETTGVDIYGCEVSGAGSRTSSDILISSDPSAPSSGATGPQTLPAVAANSSGLWLVTWEDKRVSTNKDIYCARISSAGVLLDGGGIAVTSATKDQESPAVSWDGTNFVAAWRNKTTTKITASRISAAGVVLDPSGVTVSSGAAKNIPGPAVAGSAGGSIVAWQTLGPSPPADVIGRTLSTSGSLGTETTLSTCAQDQTGGASAFDGTNVVTVWADKRSGTYSIYAARISPDGVIQDPQGVQLAASSSEQIEPSIAWSGTNYFVAWAEGPQFGHGMKGLRIDRNLAPLDSSPLTISSLADVDQSFPSVGWNGSKYLVAWQDNRNTTGEVQVLNFSGTVSGGTFTLSIVGVDGITEYTTAALARNISNTGLSTAVSSLLTAAGYDAVTITIGGGPCPADTSVTFTTAYTMPIMSATTSFSGGGSMTVDDATASSNIYAATVSATTGAVIQMSAPVSGTLYTQTTPRVTSDGNNYLVVWDDYRDGMPAIYCARLSSAGGLVDTNGVRVSSSTATQTGPAAAFDGTNYYITWDDYRTWTNYDIYGVRMSTALSRLDANDLPICTATYDQTAPSISWTGQNYVIAWQDSRNSAVTGTDIYLARVASNGALVDASNTLVSADSGPELTPVVQAAGTSRLAVFYERFINSMNQLDARICAQAPPAPTVTDDGVFTSILVSLHATWTPGDPDVTGYEYGIGTSSGAVDVVNWTSVGLATSVAATGLSLTDGGTYYFAVRANRGGVTGTPGVSDGIIVDATKPSLPVVTDDGVYTISSSTLHATWSSADPQSGIVEYQYAIGTSHGATNTVGWTSTGVTATVTATGLSLTAGTTYYFAVKAKNGAGSWSVVGTSDGITVDLAPMTIWQAKALQDGIQCRISGRTVTAGNDELGSCFYIEEGTRFWGIKVVWNGSNISERNIVDVTGVLETVGGERQIHASSVTVTTQQGAAIGPVAMNGRILGGGSANQYTPGVHKGVGMNNIGILIRMWGRVTAIGSGYMYVDDGYGLKDGTLTGVIEDVGVKVICDPTGHALGDFVGVTGICSSFSAPNGISPRMLARTAGDLNY